MIHLGEVCPPPPPVLNQDPFAGPVVMAASNAFALAAYQQAVLRCSQTTIAPKPKPATIATATTTKPPASQPTPMYAVSWEPPPAPPPESCSWWEMPVAESYMDPSKRWMGEKMGCAANPGIIIVGGIVGVLLLTSYLGGKR